MLEKPLICSVPIPVMKVSIDLLYYYLKFNVYVESSN